VLIIGSVYALIRYINFTNHYVSSDAVFVKSDTLTNLSFQLPGKIEKIYVNEGDNIKKGELLAKLDTKTLLIQEKELNKTIKSLSEDIQALMLQKAKLENDIADNNDLIKIQINKLDKLINAKKYQIEANKIKLAKLKKDYFRFKTLYHENRISAEKYDTVKTAYFAMKEEINSLNSILNSMKDDKKAFLIKLKLNQNNKKEVKRLQKVITAKLYQLKALKEKVALVKQNIKDSYIYAPFNGKVAKKFANNDEVVPAGKMILSIVNLKNLYVLDLLEETKLKDIKPGCKVKIHIDALDKNFKGYVSKILPASAATFALVPRDISSGEFTKLVQRFYVRIRFDKVPKDVKVGMSGEVTIQKCKTGN